MPQHSLMLVFMHMFMTTLAHSCCCSCLHARAPCRHTVRLSSQVALTPTLKFRSTYLPMCKKSCPPPFLPGDAKVLERLNPVLEQPVCLVLTERGDTQPVHPSPHGLQVVTTFTPPSRRGSPEVGMQGSEVSPALANRFSIVHVPDMAAAPDPEFGAEVAAMCRVLCADRADTSPQLAADLCLRLRAAVAAACGACAHALTMRSYVRLLDASFRLQQHNSSLEFVGSLHLAYEQVVKPQLSTAQAAAATAAVTKLLLSAQAGQAPTAAPPAFPSADVQPWSVHHLPPTAAAAVSNSNNNSACLVLGSHVLTPTCMATAQALLACIACNVPVLLEGEAAVGKTSLVHALATARNAPLLRINNSESTTPQDYFGAFLPTGTGSFTFKPGPLAVAMRQGAWLLIDEINLAPPAVMSMLAPLLDGQASVTVPGTGRMLAAAPGFRIIATGNSARYAGRQPLPMSLRNRFQARGVSCSMTVAV